MRVCAETLEVSYTSLLGAKDMAAMTDLPLQARIDEVSGMLYQLQKDAKRMYHAALNAEGDKQ